MDAEIVVYNMFGVNWVMLLIETFLWVHELVWKAFFRNFETIAIMFVTLMWLVWKEQYFHIFKDIERFFDQLKCLLIPTLFEWSLALGLYML